MEGEEYVGEGMKGGSERERERFFCAGMGAVAWSQEEAISQHSVCHSQ